MLDQFEQDAMDVETRWEQREKQEYVPEDEISTESYNAFLGGLFIYGLLLNARGNHCSHPSRHGQ